MTFLYIPMFKKIIVDTYNTYMYVHYTCTLYVYYFFDSLCLSLDTHTKRVLIQSF